MESNHAAIAAKQAYDLILPVERQFFWSDQSVFGRNIAGRIADVLSGHTLDGMKLSSYDKRSVPAVSHTREEKIDFIKQSIAGSLDLMAADALKAMRDLVGWIDTMVDVGRPVKVQEIGDYSMHVNNGLVATQRHYLSQLKMIGFLIIDCRSPDVVYKLGLTNELREDVESSVKAYIQNARTALANTIRRCMDIAEIEAGAPSASLSVR